MTEDNTKAKIDSAQKIQRKEETLRKYQDMLTTQREALNHIETKILIMYRELVNLYRDYYQDEVHEILSATSIELPIDRDLD